MTWLSLIYSKVAPLLAAALFSAAPLLAATVSGRIELRDSRDPAVRKRMDYSGVVVSLDSLTAKPFSSDGRATILQKDKMFTPHVLAVPVGTSVEFPNADPIFHNAFSSYSGQIFDVGLYPPGTTRAVRFARPGIVRVFCNIHSAMSAVIVVLGTPYFAVTGKDGSYSIANVPPGEYQMDVFHERATAASLQALSRRITVDQSPTAAPVVRISEAGFLPIPHNNKFGRAYPVETDDHSIYPAVRK